MKKNTILTIGLCSVLIFSMTGCSNSKDTAVNEKNNSSNVVSQADEKTDDESKENVVNGIAFKDEDRSALFSKKHKEYQFDDKAKEKLKNLNENDLVEYKIDEGKVVDVKKVKEADALVKFIGLSDSTNGQFESDGVVFNLQIPEDLVEKLENVQDNQLIKIKIKENKDGGNNILESFEVSK